MAIIYGRTMQQAEEEISWLKENLHNARSTILDLIPKDMAQLLRSYSRCASREEADNWRYDVIEAIIERATLLPGGEGEFFSRRRALCPLCGAGSHHTGEKGYAVPDGLRGHLESRGNVQRCRVMEAAYDLAARDWGTRFAAADQAAKAAKMAKLAKRRASETLYRVSPGDEPKLLDEYWHSRETRSPDQLLWAEDRLKLLGFRCVTEGRIVSWVDEHADYVVYADHRFVGRISFDVWRKPLPKNLSRRGVPERPIPMSLDLLDSFKHDLPGKYAQRLATALARGS
ncbi:MAG: hypothetical protein WAM94_20525 [Chromatiaceae bacterium]